jgi:predicted acyl esterase
MGSTCVRLRRGHRVRLHVCSAAHPRWMRNLGTGLRGLALAASTEAVPARQQVRHLGSALHLPTVAEAQLVECLA